MRNLVKLLAASFLIIFLCSTAIQAQFKCELTGDPAENKGEAIREILSVTDFSDFLAKSGYAEEFSKEVFLWNCWMLY